MKKYYKINLLFFIINFFILINSLSVDKEQSISIIISPTTNNRGGIIEINDTTNFNNDYILNEKTIEKPNLNKQNLAVNRNLFKTKFLFFIYGVFIGYFAGNILQFALYFPKASIWIFNKAKLVKNYLSKTLTFMNIY